MKGLEVKKFLNKAWFGFRPASVGHKGGDVGDDTGDNDCVGMLVLFCDDICGEGHVCVVVGVWLHVLFPVRWVACWPR